MQYLVVLFPRRRRVFVDGEWWGHTNEIIELEGGKYPVSLGPPDNYRPGSRKVDLKNTSELKPLTVSFQLVEG